MASRPDFSLTVAENEPLLASCAAAAVEAAIVAGAALLIAEPWRIGRIIRGAERLTFEELRTEVARRRALEPSADFNRVLALAQFARALEHSAFAVAWIARNGSGADVA